MRRPYTLVLFLIVWMIGISSVVAQDIGWKRKVNAYYHNVKVGAYFGGTDYNKPVFADLDHDGDGDLYVGEHDGFLNVFINEGGNPPNFSCLTTAMDSIDVGKHCAPTFWDVDLDGDLDLFMGNENGNIWHYRNDGDVSNPVWTFVTTAYIAPLLVDYHAVPFFADMDNDGDDDLLVGHNGGGAAYFLNAGSPGAPAWSVQSQYYAGLDVGSKSAVCVYDVNNDTLKDIFLAGVEGEIFLFKNMGPPENPTFTLNQMVYDVGHNGTPTLWDIDGDGDLDMFAGESDGNLNYLVNTGGINNPHWELAAQQFAYLDYGFRSDPCLVDIDADGDLDLMIGRVQGGLTFLENVGTADSAAWSLRSDSYAGLDLNGKESVTFYDLDDDGDLDMVVGCDDGTLTYLENNGTPQVPAWQPPVYNYAGVDVGASSTPVLVDIDGDNDADMLIGGSEGTVLFMRNEGTSSSPDWNDLGDFPGIDVGEMSAPEFGDIDGDGDLDLYCGNGNLTGFLYFYRNIGSALLPVFNLETPDVNGWDFGDYAVPCLGDMDGDGDIDLLVGCGAGGLWYWENVGVLYDVELLVQPYDPPIIVPGEGGDFLYVMLMNNNESFTLPMMIWTEAVFPDGITTVPIDTFETDLQPGETSEFISVEIPGEWPAGEYVFNAYAGENEYLIYSTDDFTFVKDDSLGIKDVPEYLPNGFSLNLFPNPFNSIVNIELSLSTASDIKLTLYDISGRVLNNIAEKRYTPGQHRLQLKMGDLAAGIYLLETKTVTGNNIQKLVYLK